jgi:hypothetical protein
MLPLSNSGTSHGSHTTVASVFFLAMFLAVLALLVRYAHVTIPFVTGHSFKTLLVAFLVRLSRILEIILWNGRILNLHSIL